MRIGVLVIGVAVGGAVGGTVAPTAEFDIRGATGDGTNDRTATHLSRQFAAAFVGGGIDRQIAGLIMDGCRKDRDVYQYGVFTGNGLRKIAASAKRCGHVWGFDSFQGIPKESNDEVEAWKKGNKYKTHFMEGGYSAAAALKDTSIKNVMSRVAKRVGHPELVTLIGGYFNESCNQETLQKHKMQPALYIDMDADIYLSAMQSLGWMLENQLLVPGSILRYDDWPRRNATSGPFQGTNYYGQARAHYDLSEKYDVTWQLVAHNAVQCVSVGRARCEAPQCTLAKPMSMGPGALANRYQDKLLPLWSPMHQRGGLF